MRREVHVSQFADLATDLTLSFDDGEIRLENQRMVLVHTQAFGSLRRELIDSLGIERGRTLLTRMGFTSGKSDARMAHELLPNSVDDDLLRVGPALHAFQGVGKVITTHLKIDVAAGIFDGDFIWPDSFEAAAHLATHGRHDTSVCWHALGYASGFASTIMGSFVLFREVECRGKGDPQCRVVGKILSHWHDDTSEDMRHFKSESLADQIVALQEEVALLRDSIGGPQSLEEMIGRSPAFLKVCDLVGKVADSPATVLLLGETGTGKERFARCLHDLSGRRNKPFVAVNCGAIPENLIESELFGVEEGAYTGATKSRPGRFERAHGGTLFLDEIGDLAPSAQVKLLRVLQQGEFERVGDTRLRMADVRIVAATNIELLEKVRDGGFRADLYYRLSSIPIRIPPLRERVEDIPLLAAHFLKRFATRDGRRNIALTRPALDAMQRHDWPGNIRELENTVERGVILASADGVISLPALFGPLADGPRRAAVLGGSLTYEELIQQLLEAKVSLPQLEDDLVTAAIAEAKGNISKVARRLGLSRRQVAYRAAKLDDAPE
jgi:DNA-binding NtrC family response regulator